MGKPAIAVLSIMLSLMLLLSGCSSNPEVSENKGVDGVVKVEVIKFGYQGTVTVENQKVLNITVLENEEDIRTIMDILANKKEPKANYDLKGPLGRINTIKNDGSIMAYDLWLDETYCFIYDVETEKLYTYEPDRKSKALYDLLQVVDPKYLQE